MMKHYYILSGKLLPRIIAVSCLFSILLSCQNTVDTPTMGCSDMDMTTTIQNKARTMNLTSSILFRQHSRNGGAKYLSIEAVSDTFKVILNLEDSRFEDDADLSNDSIHLDTFLFSRTGPQKGGLVVGAWKNSFGDYDYLTTDTSSITIKKINTKKKTISGSFYFLANDRKVLGEGSFENACYLSLQ
ncbi:hypothetical protein ACDQ55_04265 [Chitinophaga sp. 30R24]|uniref:hypothetical protein n=1 Tax=Chitinophaga sp. 30R24 TaxID=3248838 RepID=UPI003B91B9F4